MTTIANAVTAAIEAAKSAENEFVAKHGYPFYCGFAWIEVYVKRTNSKEAKELIAAGFEKSYMPRTLSMWNPGGSSTQSMDVKETGCHAAAKVLREAGLNAHACSRAD